MPIGQRGESDLKATQELFMMMVLKLGMDEHFQEKKIESEESDSKLRKSSP